ncbi:MAG: glycosyltransferase family 39 protein [Alphaproteobacteria bacterium]|nr:glycosyltransferase family 39 protein [Alphaproteobacteria bacterium]
MPAREPRLTAARLAALFPYAVAVYFPLQVLLRVLLSGNLEPDEAEMVQNAHWALGYGNSQPPLYQWLVMAVHAAVPYWPLAIALAKNTLLAATYLLAYDAGRRATGDRVGGALFAGGLLLVPQIVWESQVALSHSVLATAAAAAVIHALVLVLERPELRRYAWLGLAAGAGLYAKYNFTIFVGLLTVAGLSLPDLRRRLDGRGLLLALGVTAVLILPHALWALNHVAESTARLARLARPGPYAGLDLPYLGIDGLLDLLVDMASATLPLIAVWFLVRRLSPPLAPPAEGHVATELRRLLARMLLLGAVAVPVGILAVDAHSFSVRYLTPILVALPLTLVLARPQRDLGARHFLLTGLAIAVLITIAWPQTTLFGRHRFAVPYAEFAADITALAPPPLAIAGDMDVLTENLVQHIPGAVAFRPEDAPPRVLLAWTRDEAAARTLLGAGYTAEGPERVLTRRHYYFSGNTTALHLQLFRRDP